MIRKLKAWKRKQEFSPDSLGIFINPFYIARKGLYKGIISYAHYINGKVLDVGCGQKPYKHVFSTSSYIGMDIEQSGHSHQDEHIDVYYDGKVFPFEDNSFDNALTNQVFEHVFNPEEFLSEIHRVLRPGGHLLITVPFVWDEHEQPYDYARYSSFGLTHVLQSNGFKIISFSKSRSDFSVISQLTVLFFYKKLVSKSRLVNLLCCLFLLSPITLTGILLSKILPSNTDLYLDNIVLVKKI